MPWLLYVYIQRGLDGNESACNAGDPGWIPTSERSLKEGVATHSSVFFFFFPRGSLGQKSLAGYSAWICKESDMTEWLSTHTQNRYTECEGK